MNIETLDVNNFLASHPYSKSTKITYSDVIYRVFKKAGGNIENLSAAELLDLIEGNNWGNARQCVALAATQKFLNWKYGTSHPALSAKLKRIKGKPQRALNKESALVLLASFNTYRPTGARDLAIASIALDTGFRSSEICRIEIKHTNFDVMTVQAIVKGGKWRTAVFSEDTNARIMHWLNFRKSMDNDWLFTSTFTGNALTPGGLATIMKSWGARIGIKLSPHDLRRSFATLATEAGAPERILMQGGGWDDPSMIIRYTQSLRMDAMRKYLPTLQIGRR